MSTANVPSLGLGFEESIAISFENYLKGFWKGFV